MPRVHHVKKARKDIKAAGIKKGEEYFWWKFPYGEKQVSKIAPRRSQLTQSDKKAAIYDIEDEVSAAVLKAQSGMWGLSDLRDVLTQCVEGIRDVAEEYRSSARNIESVFPGGSPKIDELNERADEVEAIADELDQVAQGIEEDDEEAILKDAMDQLPKMSDKPCSKCGSVRMRAIKKNDGYGGWRVVGHTACPQCCKGLSVVVTQERETLPTFKTDRKGYIKPDATMVTYVWVPETVPMALDRAAKQPKIEWKKLTPVEFVRREREAGRIPPRVRTEAEQNAIDSAITEAESVQWNI